MTVLIVPRLACYLHIAARKDSGGKEWRTVVFSAVQTMTEPHAQGLLRDSQADFAAKAATGHGTCRSAFLWISHDAARAWQTTRQYVS